MLVKVCFGVAAPRWIDFVSNWNPKCLLHRTSGRDLNAARSFPRGA